MVGLLLGSTFGAIALAPAFGLPLPGAPHSPGMAPSITKAVGSTSGAGIGTIAAVVPVGTGPWGFAFDSSTQEVYVSNAFSDSIFVLSLKNNSVVSTLNVGHGQLGIAYDPENQCIYTALNTTVAVISTVTGQVVSSVTVGYYPYYVGYDPANGYIYVGVHDMEAIDAINGSTNALVTNISAGRAATMMAYDPANGNMYVAEYNGGDLVAISSQTDTITGSIDVGSLPVGVAYDSANGYLYVTNSGSDTISVVDPTTDAVVATIPAGAAPWGITYDSSNGYLYAANTDGGDVSVISGANESVVGSIQIGIQPWGVAYDPANGAVYVTDHTNDTVTVIDTSSTSMSLVTFSEANLPSSTPWSVTVAGQTDTSTSPTIPWNLPEGNYSYAIGDVSGWHQTTMPYTGTITVNATTVSEPKLVFFRATYSVEFVETGLPSSMLWWLNLTSGPSLSTSGMLFSLAFPNGSYAYTVAALNGSYQAPGGMVQVNASSVSIAVDFFLRMDVRLSVSSSSVSVGARVTLDTQVSGGLGPYAYTWSLNGTNLSASPNSGTWDFTAEHAGTYSYRCWVTDAQGRAAESRWANLTVTPSAPSKGGGPSDPLTATFEGVPVYVLVILVVLLGALVEFLFIRRRGKRPTEGYKDDSAVGSSSASPKMVPELPNPPS